eukprot:TRINITY_DN9226_c0_g2_i1.p1 TRINITY_DN9226_c0_g2~~TRINITY_DN9226_c0_g2_i1.p1  ORF type:complete len:446 (-),score=42.92 TRINITY_DN9226_c0_g2_i1:315-1652(-)
MTKFLPFWGLALFGGETLTLATRQTDNAMGVGSLMRKTLEYMITGSCTASSMRCLPDVSRELPFYRIVMGAYTDATSEFAQTPMLAPQSALEHIFKVHWHTERIHHCLSGSRLPAKELQKVNVEISRTASSTIKTIIEKSSDFSSRLNACKCYFGDATRAKNMRATVDCVKQCKDGALSIPSFDEFKLSTSNQCPAHGVFEDNEEYVDEGTATGSAKHGIEKNKRSENIVQKVDLLAEKGVATLLKASEGQHDIQTGFFRSQTALVEQEHIQTASLLNQMALVAEQGDIQAGSLGSEANALAAEHEHVQADSLGSQKALAAEEETAFEALELSEGEAINQATSQAIDTQALNLAAAGAHAASSLLNLQARSLSARKRISGIFIGLAFTLATALYLLYMLCSVIQSMAQTGRGDVGHCPNAVEFYRGIIAPPPRLPKGKLSTLGYD